jgi:competence protein ComEC
VPREPLLFPVAALAFGIFLSHEWPGDAGPLLLAIIGILLLAGLALFRNFRAPEIRATGIAACLTGFTLCGALLETVHRPLPPPRLDVPDLSVTILAGCVVEPPALTGDRETFLLQLGPHARARINMYAQPGEPLPQLHYGQRLQVEGSLRLPRNFGNPHAFDYRNFLARQDIFWTLASEQVTPLAGQCGDTFHRALSQIRTAALDRIADLYHGDRYNTAMMDAVLIGETSGLDRLWTEQYRSTGTFHALVISGSHVAVLAGVLLFLLRICFVPRLAATLLTVLAAWLYALITGWQAPVIRSAAGMTLFAIGSLFFRERRMLNLLAAVALGFLVLDPPQLFDPSFQLSFLAVAFLAVFAIPLMARTSQPLLQATKDLNDAGRDVHLPAAVAAHRVDLRLYADTLSAVLRMPVRASRFLVSLCTRTAVFFFDLFITSAVIQAGLALPMAMYFHRISFTGLSANAIVVPLLGVVVPAGFLALFTGSHLIAACAAFLLDLSRRTVEWHAHFEPNWRIPDPPLILSLALCAALAFAAVRWKSVWGRWLSIGGVAGFLYMLVTFPFAPHLQRGRLEFTAIDVGQGDSLFLSFPDGKIMLMDAGGIPTFNNNREAPTQSRMEIGEDVVAPYLWTRALKKIDVVAISHLHDDHAGGIPAILNDFQVSELWVGATPACDLWTRIQAKARERGTRIRHLRQGDRMQFGGAALKVLEPAADYIPNAKPGNNDSLVMLVAYGQRSLLLTGDMEKNIEADYAIASPWPHADILKVGHHGSKTSSTPDFLDQVRPGLAVISDGHGNLYGHPNRITIDNLAARHIMTSRTDQEGLISIATDGQHLWRE